MRERTSIQTGFLERCPDGFSKEESFEELNSCTISRRSEKLLMIADANEQTHQEVHAKYMVHLDVETM